MLGKGPSTGRRLGLLSLLAAWVVGGCSGLAYTGHALWGGMRILAKRRDLARQISDPATPEPLRRRLALILEIRDFASGDLALPDNGSYRTYVHLDRPYAVWNVTAAPELSVEPVTWCFPVAGCVSYRGFFREQRARLYAQKLSRRELDVDVGGVAAYSTLGWFKDPVLSTFVDWPEAELAGLVFHELAHQRLYLKGDTTFNESFATVVEEEGVRRWMLARRRPELLEEYRQARRREEEVIGLLLEGRQRLAEIYADDRPDEWKRERKAEEMARLRAGYERLKSGWGVSSFDGWFGPGLNNARLAAFSAYHRLAPGFRRLLGELGGDLKALYAEAERLASLAPERREDLLARGGVSSSGRSPPG